MIENWRRKKTACAKENGAKKIGSAHMRDGNKKNHTHEKNTGSIAYFLIRYSDK